MEGVRWGWGGVGVGCEGGLWRVTARAKVRVGGWEMAGVWWEGLLARVGERYGERMAAVCVALTVSKRDGQESMVVARLLCTTQHVWKQYRQIQ